MPHAMHAAAESWSVPVPLTLVLVIGIALLIARATNVPVIVAA